MRVWPYTAAPVLGTCTSTYEYLYLYYATRTVLVLVLYSYRTARVLVQRSDVYTLSKDIRWPFEKVTVFCTVVAQ